MIKMPLSEIIEKLKASSGMSDEDINNKIKDKMDQLSGLISKEGAAHIIANEMGVQLIPVGGALQIKNILPGMRSVETQGKVTRIFDVREFQSGERQGKVGSFFIGDETGQIRITCWHDQTKSMEGLKEGDIVKVMDGYARENNGFKELHLNDRSRLMINPENVKVGEVAGVQKPDANRKRIEELKEEAFNVELFGTIVQVYDIKFFGRCGQCKKKVREVEEGFVCDEHGTVTPDFGYVLNLFLDDGTGTIRTVFFSNQIQNLLKKTNDEILVYKDTMQSFDAVKTDLLGEQVKLIGKVVRNQMFDRLEFIANVVIKDVDPEDEIKRLKNELEQKNAS